MLLLVLAGNFLLLIVGWAFVGAASYLLISLLVPAHDRDARRASRRSSSTSSATSASCSGTFFIFRALGTARLPAARSTRRQATSPGTTATLTAGLHPAARRRVREVRPGPAAHLAPGRDGGPDAGLRADPRRDDGHRRRLPDRAHAPAVRAVGRRRRRRRRDHRLRRRCWSPATIGLVVTDLKRVIAYSTMSQIGYMIMAVSAGAYVAGLFHLMTHAFFKALLFMAAGSVIGAMARRAVLDRMGGFKRAMPFTYALLRHRRPGAGGRPAVLGLLLQGRDPGRRSARAAAAGGSSTSPATSARS